MVINIIVLWIQVLLFLLGKDGREQQFELHGFAQGTSYSIKYFAVKLSVSTAEMDSLFSVVDSSMSLYKSYSLINRFNTSTQGLVLDKHFKTVIKRSFEIFKDTEGKFDVTVAPLVEAWGFGPVAVDRFPDSATVSGLLERVGMNNLVLKGDHLIKLKPGVEVDLNGIAQGYTVDLMADHLVKKGISSFVVELGGELRVQGLKPDGTMRKIGVEGLAGHDHADARIKRILSFKNGAVTTSGNYQKFLQEWSKKRSHLIDTRTGFPLDNQMLSVTVFAQDALTADGYDNALMAMDLVEALYFVNARKALEAYFVYQLKDGNVKDTMTLGFKKMLVN